MLTEEERQRLDRLRFQRDRIVFLATRVLVRRVLSRYEPVAPQAWRFVADANGRPEVADGPAWIRFNLSNTAGLVVCAVSSAAAVGVDVERVARTAPLELIDEVFAASEAAALRALEPGAQGRRFFEVWTLKESYIKARGLGLAIPLHRFAFTLEHGHAPRITIDAELGDAAEGWQFTQLCPTPTHLVAVCVSSTKPQSPAPRPRWLALADGPATRSNVCS
jgi:4'-phosphopantetheinyl transferase